MPGAAVNSAGLAAAASLLALGMICATVLAVVKVIPGDIASHTLPMVLGGTLVYLNPMGSRDEAHKITITEKGGPS